MDKPRILADSALDSARFGIKVVRGCVPAGTAEQEVIDEVEASDAELIILRTAAGDSGAIVQLQRGGWPVIHADTLVYYGIDLTTLARRPLPPGVRLATTVDRDAIREIAERSFTGYRSHYAANPLLPADKVVAGYVEWANSRLAPENSGGCTWVVTAEDRVAGFATCDLRPDRGAIEIVLNAVHPRFSRRGLYGRLLEAILQHYAAHSYLELGVSTQLWNYTVQRQWARAGLSLKRAFATYHLDRRLRLP
ncbi:MAG: GNAT family N-acetyltransferase [Rhodanobacter sp.]|nr:MAG: GNAT family N-acetyltransferase [Rhodanobacter sp.]TAM14001.1 MAG: GNAT family N-acetyltransferase [Rhodanobacter sp.]TAM37123.1 MAG: GNAT family N-acetyltransferase [Rhodanobacter sp.]